MCGIAGRLSWTKPPERTGLLAMGQRLRHRGPDAEGLFIEGPLGLVHQRLAIIDTASDANQPMLSRSGQFVIVFNGEIYNYRELRRELEESGIVFRTASDTEVLLEAYAYWGLGCLDRLNGMFAFAIWDRAARRLLLARDRVGKKPLFYYPLPDGGVLFASELKALRCNPDVPSSLNPKAIAQFLMVNYILSSECITAGVHKLGAGECLTIEEDHPAHRRSYWSLASKFHHKTTYRTENEAVETLTTLLDDAVRIRLVSDVPLGAFLSGGLDSSSVVASMQRSTDAGRTHTFNVGFSEASYDERMWARDVAGYLGVEHHDTVVSSDITSEIERMVYFADEPFADTSLLPMYALARFAKQSVTVCLSGDGADELFGGYDTYVADKLQRLVRRLPSTVLSMGEFAARALVPVTRRKVGVDYQIRQFCKGMKLPSLEAHYSWRTIAGRDDFAQVLAQELAETVGRTDAYDDWARWSKDVEGCHYLDQAMYLDVKTWLTDDILVKVDRATMAHSLEARAPFLDYRLVEFAASLPVDFKLRGVTGKYLLKRSQEARLPRKTIYRRKRGFNAPISHWMDGELREKLTELTTDSKTKSYFNRPAVEQLLDEHERYEADHGMKLFGTLCLGLWISQC